MTDRARISRAIEENGRASLSYGNSSPVEEHRGIFWLGRLVIDTKLEPDQADSAILNVSLL